MIQLTFECNIPVWGYRNPPQKHRKKWTKNYNADEEKKKNAKLNVKHRDYLTKLSICLRGLSEHKS